MTSNHIAKISANFLYLVNQSAGLEDNDRALYRTGLADAAHAVADAFRATKPARAEFLAACGLGAE